MKNTNRIIKFRAWDSYQNKMYDWNKICEDDEKGNLTLTNLLNDFIDHIEPMQYTGLKDKNGKEIYEGDILKDHGIVAWNDIELCWSRIDLNWNDKREWYNLDSLTSPMEIIGNIHDNPELIK